MDLSPVSTAEEGPGGGTSGQAQWSTDNMLVGNVWEAFWIRGKGKNHLFDVAPCYINIFSHYIYFLGYAIWLRQRVEFACCGTLSQSIWGRREQAEGNQCAMDKTQLV